MNIRQLSARFCSAKTLCFSALLVATVGWIDCLPEPLFDTPRSTQLLDAEGGLLGAKIASDGQWRMPAADSVSPRVLRAVIEFEDRRFYYHDGIDLRSVLRAAYDNFRAGRVVSGGSTITMQVARMAAGSPSRTLLNKVVEVIRATRLESKYTKEEILRLWLANASFGGNTVGIEAASQRYYGRPPASLSWAEAATLAVLPNAPALIRPGRNSTQLEEKRNRLLTKLYNSGHLHREELVLARLEVLPHAPQPLPRLAPHLLERTLATRGPGRYRSDIHRRLQVATGTVLAEHHRRLRQNQIFNLAVRVSEVATGRTIVYHGNVPEGIPTRSAAVDMITAPRSPGSLLKPLLYAAALDEGILLPTTLLPDVPTRFRSFRPSNFHESYDGAVPANEALIRSLNIPFVYLLRDYGYAKFYRNLAKMGFRRLTRPADHYGLSMILGGVEITQDEIHDWFLGAAQVLTFYDSLRQSGVQPHYRGLDAASIYLTFEQLRELTRPDNSGAYRQFASHQPVAWKTGTSYGFRDAWAVGATTGHVVSVWVGNANGEGRPGLVGIEAAAPVLFDILRLLNAELDHTTDWFPRPYDALTKRNVCRESGYLPTPICPVRTALLPTKIPRMGSCPYHRHIITSTDGMVRTTRDCDPGAKPGIAFVLPTRQAHYYRRTNPEYTPLPPFDPECRSVAGVGSTRMRLLYPEGGGVLRPVKNWKGETEPFLFAIAHPSPEASLYWHLDGEYYATTNEIHHTTAHLDPGHHELTVTDDQGNRLHRRFRVK